MFNMYMALFLHLSKPNVIVSLVLMKILIETYTRKTSVFLVYSIPAEYIKIYLSCHLDFPPFPEDTTRELLLVTTGGVEFSFNSQM